MGEKSFISMHYEVEKEGRIKMGRQIVNTNF